MFAGETSAVVQSVGAEETLISNSNLNQKVELLSLVRVSQARLFGFPKYQPVDITLPDLLEDEDFRPEVKEELLVKDFRTSVETSRSGRLGGGHQTVGDAAIAGTSDSVDGQAEPVSIKKKTADLKGVRKTFHGRKFKRGQMELLRLRDRDKLAFVHETLFNTGPVTMTRKSGQDGSVSGTCQKLLNLLVQGSRKEETTFTVPERSTFAFGLQEILWDDETIKIPLDPWTHKKNLSLFTSDSVDPDQLQEAREGIQNKSSLLKPLTRLPQPTRQDLLQKLQQVLEEDGALGQLEETLDQSSKGQTERPPSKVVSSFMDVLDESKVSSKVRDAVHLLVCAMDGLPEVELRPLTSCAPETLAVLVQLVDTLKDGDEPSLPACPPVPLQQDGELRWAADVLCGSSETLVELSAAWDRRPEVLMEVLALAVLGVHRLQDGTGPDE